MSLDFTKPNSTASYIKVGAFFSPGEECQNAILQFIKAARQSLDICVFTISDNLVTEAILEAFARGIRIRILTDNEKLYDKGSDIQQLSKAGLDIRIDQTKNHMHHKFAIADGLFLLTGSYNWTRSAALYNHENVLITKDPVAMAGYQQQFKKLWAEMVPMD